MGVPLSCGTTSTLQLAHGWKSHLLCRRDLRPGGWNVRSGVHVEEANSMLQQLQQVLSEDHSMQVKRLSTAIGFPHVWGDRKGLMVVTLQRFYQLPDLHQQSHY